LFVTDFRQDQQFGARAVEPPGNMEHGEAEDSNPTIRQHNPRDVLYHWKLGDLLDERPHPELQNRMRQQLIAVPTFRPDTRSI
jgi:hypothetical protein